MTSPAERGVGMVFSLTRSIPTCQQNMSFGLKLAGAKKVINQRVNQVAEVPLAHLLDRKPKALGGQRQRGDWPYAGGQPSVFLLDEPLSNLDAALCKCVSKSPVCINAWAAQ